MTTAAERLAQWGLSLMIGDVPSSARQAARVHLLDGLGVGLLAVGRGQGTFGVDVARSSGVATESSVLGTGVRAPAAMAALANGVLVHALDYDDTHTGALCHPTSVVLPVAFACGEARKASGAEVLTAAIAGYETIIRIGLAVRHGFHARGFHATSVCGVFSAALVAARLQGLDEGQTVNALGIAGSQASGLLEFLDTPSATKQLHPGWAAHSGIIAAQLAAAGATGPDSILEGRYGLYRAFADVTVDPDAITAGLGERWEVEATSIKPYPACQLSHACLDALLSLRARVKPADVSRITFDVPDDTVPIVCEPRAQKLRPRSAYEAKFSLPWSAAALMIDGDLGVATFDAVDRPDVLALAERVEHNVIDSKGPPGDTDGRVRVTMRDGATLEATAAGGGRAATTESVLAKLRSHQLPSSDALVDAVLTLEAAPDLGAVLGAVEPMPAMQ